MVHMYNFGEVRDATSNFSGDRTNVLGRGGFGYVYKAVLNGVQVAVKKLNDVQPAELMRALEVCGKVPEHNNLLNLSGVAVEHDTVCLVYPRMETDLRRALLRDPPLPPKTRLAIAHDCAAGLNALHAASLVHRDLKPANVLLDAQDGAKLADFGLARSLGSASHVRTRIAGTGVYMDPEYTDSEELRKSSDVYSFGVMLLELLTGALQRLPPQETGHHC